MIQVWICASKTQSAPPSKNGALARCQWLTPAILTIQEAEIRRIKVRSQLGKQLTRSYLENKPITKIGLVEWLQGEGPEFEYPVLQKK
jgi:hypothetical protein